MPKWTTMLLSNKDFWEELLTPSDNVCSSKNHDEKERNIEMDEGWFKWRDVCLLLENKYHKIKIHLNRTIQNKPNVFGLSTKLWNYRNHRKQMLKDKHYTAKKQTKKPHLIFR